MKAILKESAFKHGLTKDEILHALTSVVKSKSMFNKKFDNYNKWAIGLLPDGNTCEILFFYQDEETMIVFHAMSPARKEFIKEVERKR